MSNSIFTQKFAANFTGIDGEMSALEEDIGGVNRAVNLEYAVGNSLRGRLGCQTLGRGFFAVFPYSYTRTQDQYDIAYQVAAGTYPTQTASLTTTKTSADGASISKLIGINRQVWILDTMNITVTYVSGTYPFTWYTAVSGSNINFNIKANGVSILNTSLGDGISSSTSIYSLLGTIDGLAELSISRTTRGTCPPFAIVNGNQVPSSVGSSPVGTIYRITVDSGHNFSAGDIISWFDTNTLTGGMLTGGIVLATTSTTIDYIGVNSTLVDDQVLGYMAQPATAFSIGAASTAGTGNLTLSFPYWRLLPEGDQSTSISSGSVYGGIYTTSIRNWFLRTSRSFYAPAVASNQDGNLYITASADLADGGSGSTYGNNLIKVDGLQVTRAGLPAPSITQNASGAGSLTGAYKYKCFLRRYDGQGNIIDGLVSDIATKTYAAQYGSLTFVPPLYSNTTGFQVRGCYKHTTESPTTGQAFYVDDSSGGVGNQAFIQPGDVVCLTDNTAQTTGLWTNAGLSIPVGSLHRTRCTAYSAQATTISPTTSSIRVADSSGYQINTNTEISAGLTLVMLRTTAGGNQYYVLGEIPITGLGSPTIYDDVVDSALIAKEQYVEIELGKEHNPPPPCTLVCAHQGGLVVARGPTSPNTVAFSSADGIEYFPTASNSFDIPSTQSGFITAIASDTNDRLAVFKARAYYDVVGDLDGGAFSINVKAEGDFGIASQASLKRIQDTLIGVGQNGFLLISNGQFDSQAYRDLSARLIAQNYYFQWAVAENDAFNRNYVCSIPTTGEPVSFVIDYSRDKPHTFERSYTTKIDQGGGMALVDNTLYHLSLTSPYGVFRRLDRFDGNSPSGNGDGDSFIDNTNAITYILESSPINFGEPAQLKTPIRIRLWSIPNDYVEEGWVPFSTLIETGASAIAQYVGGSSPNATSSTVTFSTANDAFKEVKLVNCKTHFYIVRLTTNTIRTAPFWTGYEVLFKQAYVKEDLAK